MRLTLSILAILILCSFSCATSKKARQVKKAYKIAAKYDLHTEVPVTLHDTVYVPKLHLDTVVRLKGIYDTIRIDTGRLTVRIVRLPKDSIYVEGICQSDTIFVSVTDTIKVPFISKWTYAEQSITSAVIKWYRWGVAILIFIVIGFLLYKFWDKLYPLIKIGAAFFGVPLP